MAPKCKVVEAIFGGMKDVWLDKVNFISKLSFSRVWNATKAVLSFYYSKQFKTTFHPGFPLSLSVEPTTACNLRCPECPSGLRSFTRATGTLKLDSFSSMISQVKDKVSYVNFYFQGEPYINPDFLQMVRKAADAGIYTSTSTNAHFLNENTARKTVESGLDRLIISIDGVDQKTYANYRREGRLDKVIEGTKNIISWKRKLKSKTPHIIFQFLVVKPNEHQIDKVKQLGLELGVGEVRLKTAQIYDYENGSELIPSIDKYSRYRKLPNGKWTIKNKLEDHCWRMWSSAVITWDGNVVPCCFDKDAQHAMGNVLETNLTEIWNADAYRNFRRTVLKSRSEIEMCKNCSEGSTVWA